MAAEVANVVWILLQSQALSQSVRIISTYNKMSEKYMRTDTACLCMRLTRRNWLKGIGAASAAATINTGVIAAHKTSNSASPPTDFQGYTYDPVTHQIHEDASARLSRSNGTQPTIDGILQLAGTDISVTEDAYRRERYVQNGQIVRTTSYQSKLPELASDSPPTLEIISTEGEGLTGYVTEYPPRDEVAFLLSPTEAGGQQQAIEMLQDQRGEQ
jgi:hypothetical protein